jgi:photosystem II stability/assembly factor-like uncharacterized protein
MNRYYFIPGCFLFLSIQLSFAQGSWQRIPVPTARDLHDLCFTDSLQGWVVGDSGTILHTPDGGDTWDIQTSPTTHRIESVFFIDEKTGWAAAQNYIDPPYGTVLLKTSDGGAHWTGYIYPEENIFIYCIHYFDSLTGLMGGSPHALVKTTDGGLTWDQVHIDTSTLAFFPVLNMTFLDDQTGYACGGIFDIAGVIWQTVDGGESWTAIDPSQAPADEVHAIHIFDEQAAIGAGGDPDYGYGVGMIRTFDGGSNWVYEDIGIQGIAFDIDFRNDSEAWSPLGPLRKMIWSADGGASWTELPTPDTVAIFNICFPDSLHGYAAGSNGAFLRYIPPLPPAVPPNSYFPESPISVTLFPNPAEGSSKFKVQSSKSGELFIGVFDLTGKYHFTIADERIGAGEYFFNLDAEHLSAGIYLCHVLFDGTVAGNIKFVKLP